MKKRVLLLFIVVIVFSIILSGCTNPLTSLKDFFLKKAQVQNEQNEKVIAEQESLSEPCIAQPDNTRPTVMYYKDSEGLLVPVMRYIPKGELGIAKASISALVYSAESAKDLEQTGLLPTLPMNTSILGAVVKDSGLAIVDFSKEFENFSTAEAEQTGVKSVVYTLTEFPNIKTVEIRVEGKNKESLSKGTQIGSALKRTEINLKSNINSGDKLSKVMVYYQKKGSGRYTYFVPVTKLVSGYTNSAEAALNSLIEGPGEGSSLVNPFPEGTRLLGVEVKDGIAFVNLSEEVLKISENKQNERAMIKAVSLTLGEFPEISKVRIFVDGKTIENSNGIGANEYLDVPIFVNFYD